MSEPRTHAGTVLMVGLPGPTLDREVAERLRRLDPGGVILFGRNLESAGQTTRLLEQVGRILSRPLLRALDQEGGRVSRLQPWIGATPTAAALARAGEEAARRFGRATAHALLALGFNVDFAPVVDLCDENATNGIGDRSFGIDPERVAGVAGAFLEGLQRGGVAGCLKHFPGLGPTQVDSHLTLPTADVDRDAWERVHRVPYLRLASRSAAVMVGHGHYPALDPTPDLPATLSPLVVTELLRNEVGFRGLVVGDDMEMGAMAPLDREGGGAARAIAAGCDLLIYGADLDRAERAKAALARVARTDPLFARRLEQAGRTVHETSSRWILPPGAENAWDVARRDLATFASVC